VILVGDPTKAETIVQRTKFPPHYRVPPHTHPYAEVVTVLSGNYWNSFGQSFDKSKGIELHPGSVFVLPAGARTLYVDGRYRGDRPGEFYGPRGSDFH
jgi:quercetin dioxygenase-like cupin family protein